MPIFLISIDTLRADRLPAYGSARVATPAIDALARDGIVFENAYAQVPLTLPSHASMLTGAHPYQTKVRGNIGYRLESESTLPRLLKLRGYATGGFVSAYVLRAETGIARGFDRYDDSLEVHESATLGALQRSGGETVREALQWIDKVGTEHFFAFVHLFEPHSPYQPAEPFRSQYRDPYDGEIATVDAILETFFGELRRRDLYDQSLILLTSDHGEGLGDHGEAEHGVLLYREALHVPLILKLPQSRLGGRRVDTPAQLVDVVPTLLAVTGAATPSGLPGTSLITLAESGGDASRTVYSETLYPRLHLGWSELRSLIDRRHHYIESPEPELFDVTTDSSEKKNLRTDRRRDAHAMAEQLSRIPLNLEQPGTEDPEEVARLAALGYLGGAPGRPSGPPRNPRDHIHVLKKVQQTFVLNQQRRYLESIELCREILRDYAELVDIHNQLAGTLRQIGRLHEAREIYHQAIRRSPQLVDSFAIEVAKLELDLGNFEAAELNARQAMKLNPAEAHLVLAAVALARRDLQAAEAEARLATDDEKRPRVPALILLAKILIERNRLQEALAAIDRAQSRITADGAPAVHTLSSTRGDILARMGRTAEAEAAFRKELAEFPRTTEAYVRLALLFASQHRFDEIAPTLDTMVKAVPTPATYELAARAMTDFGNIEGARLYRRRGQQLARTIRR